ncbi:UDP-3-O-(3-hydroxymyristoyl)glucosamine N-acyltransferase [Rhodobacteraceae bacterium XHP0102]|nr:UDP-3-O-(3-hydroxymyristoyl)glucosamine N-acyltransferase [Rhodobacteraceae bacterium XHP0102]
MSGYTIAQIAKELGARAEGAIEMSIARLSEPATAAADHLALAMSEKYLPDLAQGAAEAAILAEGTDWRALGLKAAILIARPRYAMAGVTSLMDQGPQIAPGIHPTAVIDPQAEIGANAAIGPFVVIGAGVRIGPRARIAPHVSIAERSEIGADALIHAGVRIAHDVTIGDRVIIQPNAVIGGDGFSFVTPEKSQVEVARQTLGKSDAAQAPQSWARIHSLGRVVIGDDVEIGSGAAIDRGTVANTEIGSGTKIDNLVHIGHNCRIGRDCLLCGQVGFAGSCIVGDRVVLGGQCGVSDNIEIGSDVVAAGATKIYSSLPSGRMVMGSPAVKMETHIEMYKAQRRLPRLAKTVAALEKKVNNTDT